MLDKYTDIELHTRNHMPILGLGTWGLSENTAEMVSYALELGYRMIDTSGDYGTQPGIAEGIKRSGADRDDYYITTKIEEDDNAYMAMKRNLAELDLEYTDLVLIHRPPKHGVGEHLWRGLIRARNEGLTVDIGVSNYSIAQIQALAELTGELPVVNQIEWSPFGWSADMLEFCYQNDIVIQAYSPLTHGRRLADPMLQEIAIKHTKSPAQILLRWAIQMGTIPLPKAGQVQHLEDNIEIFDIQLDEEDMAYLSTLNEGYSALGKRPVYQMEGV